MVRRVGTALLVVATLGMGIPVAPALAEDKPVTVTTNPIHPDPGIAPPVIVRPVVARPVAQPVTPIVRPVTTLTPATLPAHVPVVRPIPAGTPISPNGPGGASHPVPVNGTPTPPSGGMAGNVDGIAHQEQGTDQRPGWEQELGKIGSDVLSTIKNDILGVIAAQIQKAIAWVEKTVSHAFDAMFGHKAPDATPPSNGGPDGAKPGMIPIEPSLPIKPAAPVNVPLGGDPGLAAG